jgi:protease I
VKGRRLTSFWGDGVPAEIVKAGGNYVDAEVVVDGNLVTSRYPGDLPVFVSETLKMFRKYHKER